MSSAAVPDGGAVVGLEVLDPLGVAANGRDHDPAAEPEAEQRDLTGLAADPAGALEDHGTEADRQRRTEPGLHEWLHHPVESPEEHLLRVVGHDVSQSAELGIDPPREVVGHVGRR